MTELNRWEQSIFDSGFRQGKAESAAKVAKLELQLYEATAAHGTSLLSLHRAAFETIPELERKLLNTEERVRERIAEVEQRQADFDGAIVQRDQARAALLEAALLLKAVADEMALADFDMDEGSLYGQIVKFLEKSPDA